MNFGERMTSDILRYPSVSRSKKHFHSVQKLRHRRYIHLSKPITFTCSPQSVTEQEIYGKTYGMKN